MHVDLLGLIVSAQDYHVSYTTSGNDVYVFQEVYLVHICVCVCVCISRQFQDGIMRVGPYATFVLGACCLLMVLGVPQATGTPIGRQPLVTGKQPATDWQQQKYDELNAAIQESQRKERLIEELQVNAHCPFQIFYTNNITEILCDRLQMRNCTGDLAGCKDVSDNCHQAYAYVNVSRPSTQVGRRRKVKVGCIYHPKGIGLSVEDSDTAHPHSVE